MPDLIGKHCPYLGLKEDRKSLVGFPSTGNFCFHCKTPAVPLMEHQTQFCLEAAYSSCPVLSIDPKLPFPAKLKAKVIKAPAEKSNLLRNLLFLVVLFLILIISALFYKKLILSDIPAESLTTIPVLIVETATPTEFLEPLIISTLDLPTTVPTETTTPVPTSTPVLFQKHALDTPIAVEGNVFIIHKVLPKENFDILNKTYNTNVTVIRAINYLLPNSLWVNLPLVLSPGMTTVHPKLPAFEAYMITDAAVSIDDLAVQKKVDTSLIRQFNNCTQGCILHEGDWVLLPHPQ